MQIPFLAQIAAPMPRLRVICDCVLLRLFEPLDITAQWRRRSARHAKQAGA